MFCLCKSNIKRTLLQRIIRCSDTTQSFIFGPLIVRANYLEESEIKNLTGLVLQVIAKQLLWALQRPCLLWRITNCFISNMLPDCVTHKTHTVFFTNFFWDCIILFFYLHPSLNRFLCSLALRVTFFVSFPQILNCYNWF